MHLQDAVAVEHQEVVLAVEIHPGQHGERRLLRFLDRHLARGREIAIAIDRVDGGLHQRAQLGLAVLEHAGAHVQQHEGRHADEHGREHRDDEKEFLADGEFVQHFDPDAIR